MSDLQCIYDMTMIDNKDNLKEDILRGPALSILLSLLASSKTARELSRELNIPLFSMQLYLSRLMSAEMVCIESTAVIENKIEKIYALASKDIEIMNLVKNSNLENNDEVNIDLSAQQFSTMTKQVIKNINKYKGKTHKIKAYFIKTDDEKMKQFKKELEELFIKYQGLEDEKSTETYGLIGVLAPFGAE